MTEIPLIYNDTMRLNNRKFHRQYFTVLLCAMVLIAASGCGKEIKSRDRTLLLENTVNSYARLIRWGEWREAAKHIRPRPANELEVELDELAAEVKETPEEEVELLPSDIQVSNYQSHGINSNNELTEALVIATIDYYRKDSVSIRQLEYRQDWWYDEQSKRWYMDGRLPFFCTRIRERRRLC